jgi:hypothetical protein
MACFRAATRSGGVGVENPTSACRPSGWGDTTPRRPGGIDLTRRPPLVRAGRLEVSRRGQGRVCPNDAVSRRPPASTTTTSRHGSLRHDQPRPDGRNTAPIPLPGAAALARTGRSASQGAAGPDHGWPTSGPRACHDLSRGRPRRRAPHSDTAPSGHPARATDRFGRRHERAQRRSSPSAHLHHVLAISWLITSGLRDRSRCALCRRTRVAHFAGPW